MVDVLQRKVSVIIPNKNDALSLERYLLSVVSVLEGECYDDYEVIVVDDGSEDLDKVRIVSLVREVPKTRLFFLSKNFGQQVALFYGLQAARFDAIITIDGDGQYPANIIPKLAQAVFDGFDLASGVRKDRSDKWTEVISSWVGCKLIQVMMKTTLVDFGSCKGFSRSLANKIVSFQFGVPDVYPAALYWSPKIKEINFEHLPREIGQSKWNLTKRVKLFFDIYIKYGEDNFGLIFKLGIITIVTAIIGLILMVGYKVLFSHQSSYFLILTLFGIAVSVGFQFILWNLFLSTIRQQMRRDSFSYRPENLELLFEEVDLLKSRNE